MSIDAPVKGGQARGLAYIGKSGIEIRESRRSWGRTKNTPINGAHDIEYGAFGGPLFVSPDAYRR